MTFDDIRTRLTTLARSRQGRRLGVVLLLVVLGVIGQKMRPLPVKALTIKKQTSFAVRAEGKGRLKALEEGFLAIKKGGRLDRLFVAEGDAVKKGQIIGVVDEKTLRAGVESAMSSYRLASTELARVERLRQTRSATVQELDQLRSNALTRRADLETARQKLEDGIVRSPFDGTIATIAFKVGDFVPDGARVAIVENRTGAKVTTKIAQQLRGELPPRALVSVRRDGDMSNGGVEAMATLTALGAGSDYDNADFDLQITFESFPVGVNLGDTIQVAIALETVPTVWRVKSLALVEQSGVMTLPVVNGDGKLKLAAVDVLGVKGDVTIIRKKPRGKPVWPLEGDDMRKALVKRKSVRVMENNKGRSL